MDITPKSSTDHLNLLHTANKNTRQLQVENPRPISEVTLPAAVYHGSKEHQPDVTYSEKLSLTYGGVAESYEDFSARTGEAWHLLTIGISKASAALKETYDSVITDIDKTTLNKNWSFSLQADGSLQLTDPFNVLTQDEKDIINKEIIYSRPLALAASDLADTFIRGLELERGPNKAARNIARFNLTRENFAQIIDLKGYVGLPEQPKSIRASQEVISDLPFDKHRAVYMYYGLNYLSDQLKANAEPKWSVEAFRERHKDYYKSSQAGGS